MKAVRAAALVKRSERCSGKNFGVTDAGSQGLLHIGKSRLGVVVVSGQDLWKQESRDPPRPKPKRLCAWKDVLYSEPHLV